MSCRSLVAAFLLAALGPLATVAAAQQNASFEQAAEADSSQPAHWRAGGQGYEATLTGEAAYEGARSLRIERVSPQGRFGVATQVAAPADSLAGKRVRLSGYIKAQGVEEGQAALWVRADGPSGMLSIDNMQGRGATGTADWARYEAEILVPQETEQIIFGALMPGSGTAWFDALKVEARSPDELPPPSEEARGYLSGVLDTMQARSINRDSIDWTGLRSRTMRWARGAGTTAETYPALRYAIGQLGDNHSFLRPPQREESGGRASGGGASGGGAGEETGEAGRGWQGPAPQGQLLAGHLGYVRVPGFTGDQRAQTAFADSLQRVVARLDRQGTCGWVVDLRADTGGNMWPMLAGLGPVLGEGEAGRFVYPNGKEIAWWYRGGKAGNGGNALAEVSGKPYKLKGSPRPPVAVLTGPRTASSGEAVAVSFRGRPKAKSFGQPTRGLSTSNATITLSDGAMLALTTSTFADRAGTVYGGRLVPDVSVEPKGPPAARGLSEDPALEAARSWLQEQERCAMPDEQ